MIYDIYTRQQWSAAVEDIDSLREIVLMEAPQSSCAYLKDGSYSYLNSFNMSTTKQLIPTPIYLYWKKTYYMHAYFFSI